MSAEILKPPVLADVRPGAPAAHDDPHGSMFDVPEMVVKGTTMMKISKKSGVKRVEFRLDPDEGRLEYKSRKNGHVPLEAVKEIRTGTDTRSHREELEQPAALEDRWLTLIYVLNGAYKTLHIVADTRDVFAAWARALRKMHAVRQGLAAGTAGDAGAREALWARQYWKGADAGGDQRLDFADVQRMCARLHANIPAPELRRLFRVRVPCCPRVRADAAVGGRC